MDEENMTAVLADAFYGNDTDAKNRALFRASEVIVDLRNELAALRREKWNWEHRARERWALRKELEEALGFKDRETYDQEKFEAAVSRVRSLMASQH